MRSSNQVAYTYFTSVATVNNTTWHARIYIQHEDNVGLLHSRTFRTREEAQAYATSYKEARQQRDEEYINSLK